MSTGSISTAATAAALDPGNYRFLQEFVYQESGIVLDGDKNYLLEARLMPIVTRERLGSLNDLCAVLRGVNGGAVKQQVVDSMTTNETLFFREPAQYEALRTAVLPELLELRRASQRLSFWSAASSTGQEAYSLAMLLLEMGWGAGTSRSSEPTFPAACSSGPGGDASSRSRSTAACRRLIW